MRLLITSLLLICGAFGQQGNTVFSSVVVGRFTDGNFPIAAQYMIGQSGHQAIITLDNRGANTCLISTIDFGQVQIQGSYDNSTWINISPKAMTNTSGVAVATGQGVYPFIRLVGHGNNYTNCTYSLFYGGIVSNVTAAPNTVTPSTYSVATNSSSNFNLVAEKGARITNSSAPIAGGSGNTAVVAAYTGVAVVGSQIIIDCIHADLIATGTIATGINTSVDLVFPGPISVPLFYMGIPAGAIGTYSTRDVCGLNLYAGLNDTVGTFPKIQFSVGGTTNVFQHLTASFFAVNQ